MVANQRITQIDTLELKAVMYRKIGHQKANKYFDMLKRFFSFKLGKYEFDRSCIRTIGRENLSLHNQLIHAILKNSCLAKVPPLRVKKVANGHQRNGLYSIYGEAFPPSPRKCRSPRGRKFRDGPSPLGLLGKAPNLTCEVGPRTQEQQSATELHSLGSRPPVEVGSVEDGEEVEQAAGSPGIQSRSPIMGLTAPLGISMKMGGARKTFFSGSRYNFHPLTCHGSCELPDTKSLRDRLEQKLGTEGLSISVDCANLLNNGLDCYLKRLIEPCIGLAGSRRSDSIYASMLDFTVPMGSNPRLLGGDWAIQLEKVLSRAFEE